MTENLEARDEVVSAVAFIDLVKYTALTRPGGRPIDAGPHGAVVIGGELVVRIRGVDGEVACFDLTKLGPISAH